MISIYQTGLAVTSQGHLSLLPTESTWKKSRPNEIEPRKEQLYKTDVPVHEFSRFNVWVEAPIILREWIASFRDHIMWARTSRVDDLTKWPICEDISLFGDRNLRHHAIIVAYNKMMQEKDANQDHFRRHIPLGYMTGFSLNLSFRSAIKLIKSSAALAEVLPPTNSALFGKFSTWLHQAIGSATGYHNNEEIDIALKSFSSEDPLARGVHFRQNSYLGLGGFVIGQLKDIPLTLRAQMVRHRPLMIRDNLFELLLDDEIMTKSMEHPMSLEFSCTKEVAERIVTKRNCWIAQEDLWSPVIKLINNGSAEPRLPCSDGKPCTAARDNQLRREGKDPAPPCPRYAKLAGEPLTDEQKEAAKAYLPLRPLTRDFWEREIES